MFLTTVDMPRAPQKYIISVKDLMYIFTNTPPFPIKKSITETQGLILLDIHLQVGEWHWC